MANPGRIVLAVAGSFIGDAIAGIVKTGIAIARVGTTGIAITWIGNTGIVITRIV